MKKIIKLTMLAALLLIFGSSVMAMAEIIPPHGEGQYGLQAVVLCEELTVRQNPSSSSEAVKKLQFGYLPIVIRQSNGWAYCILGDSEDSPYGWINADYIAIDPAWYRTEKSTPVYAWNELTAPKVALLDKDKTLPILKQEGDWILISLRGAAGWIHL